MKNFIQSVICPVPSAKLKPYPEGNIRQYWSENPALYSSAFKKYDEYSQSLCGHPGLDIATFQGDTIVAAHTGTVTLRDYPNGGGKTVYIESPHFDWGYAITSYGHNDKFLVVDGETVKAGQPIAYQGNTGFVVSGNVAYWNNAPAGKGVHCHFSIVFYNPDGSPKYPNCMGNSSDPLVIITSGNPDYTSLQKFLILATNYLKRWQQ